MDYLSAVFIGSTLTLAGYLIWKMPNPLTIHNRPKTYFIYAVVSAVDPTDLYGTPQSPTPISFIINSRPSSLCKKILAQIDPNEQKILIQRIQVL